MYPAGGENGCAARHVDVHREVTGTGEVLIVREGAARSISSTTRQACRDASAPAGDVIVLFGGGHGFRMLEDTTFLEVKQGPYTGLDEKERF